jgi:hypothetical protein
MADEREQIVEVLTEESVFFLDKAGITAEPKVLNRPSRAKIPGLRGSNYLREAAQIQRRFSSRPHLHHSL